MSWCSTKRAPVKDEADGEDQRYCLQAVRVARAARAAVAAVVVAQLRWELQQATGG